jgi:hypothetical protein
MTEFKATHDDTPKIVALKKKFNKALEQIRFQLWKKSERIARLERKIRKLERGEGV